LTVDFLSHRRILAPAIWLKPESEFPSAEDAVASSLDTVLDQWLDLADERNLGVRLLDGHVEMTIKAADEAWTFCLFQACAHLKIDARMAYGPVNRPPAAMIVRIEDPTTIEPWRKVWPRGFKTKSGDWTETQTVYSTMPTAKAATPVWRNSKPLPGSIADKTPIVWRPNGEKAVELGELAPQPLGATTMPAVIRAHAYASLIYWIAIALDGLKAWDESLVRILGEWLAREAVEGKAINARGKSLEGVCWAPVDSPAQARDLLKFLHERVGAPKTVEVTFGHAETELKRDPRAPVSHWGALGKALSELARIGLRRAFRAGQDISAIEGFSDRYVYDLGGDQYFDREALINGAPFRLTREALVHRYSNQPVFIDRKKLNPFRLYTESSLRSDISADALFPGEAPGGVLRFSSRLGVIRNDHPIEVDEYFVLNTYRGFVIKPSATVDRELLNKTIAMIDVMLGLITRDNPDQILWLKKWIAWTVQHPEIKQQIAPILVGGQGIGKSRFGKQFMTALFDELAGEAEGRLLSGDFGVTMFLDKLVVFLDEVVFKEQGAVEQMKKIIRSDRVSGSLKGQDARTYNVFARAIFATNKPNFGLNENSVADRALFWILGHDADSKGMTTRDFQRWTDGLMDFYIDLDAKLKQLEVRRCLMHYFMNEIEVSLREVISLEFSSVNDASVTEATMSNVRQVCRKIVGEGTVDGQHDITAWFSFQDLADGVQYSAKQLAIRSISAEAIKREFQRAGILETMHDGWMRFKYRHGTLAKKLGEAFGMNILAPLGSEEGDNPVMDPKYRPPYRGQHRRKWGGQPQAQPQNPHADDEGPIP